MYPSAKRFREEQLSEGECVSECFQNNDGDSTLERLPSLIYNDPRNENRERVSKEKPECCFKTLVRDGYDTCGIWEENNGEKVGQEMLEKRPQTEKPLVSQNIYFLNKSHSKWVCVGLSTDMFFEPLIKIVGVKKQCITLNEEEWRRFLTYKSELAMYFKEKSNVFPILQSFNIKMTFDCFDGINKILKLQKNGECLFLSFDGLSELWCLEGLISTRLDNLKGLQYGNYYKEFVDGLILIHGDVKGHIDKLLNGSTVENTCITRELIYYDFNKILSDIRLCRAACM